MVSGSFGAKWCRSEEEEYLFSLSDVIFISKWLSFWCVLLHNSPWSKELLETSRYATQCKTIPWQYIINQVMEISEKWKKKFFEVTLSWWDAIYFRDISKKLLVTRKNVVNFFFQILIGKVAIFRLINIFRILNAWIQII